MATLRPTLQQIIDRVHNDSVARLTTDELMLYLNVSSQVYLMAYIQLSSMAESSYSLIQPIRHFLNVKLQSLA